MSLRAIASGDVSAILSRIGSTPSVAFKGESRKDRRNRRRFDKKARAKGQDTSTDMWKKGLYWKTGGALPQNLSNNRTVRMKSVQGAVSTPVDNTAKKSVDLSARTVIDGVKAGVVKSIVESNEGEKAKTQIFKDWLKKWGGYVLAALFVLTTGIVIIVKKLRKKRRRR